MTFSSASNYTNIEEDDFRAASARYETSAIGSFGWLSEQGRDQILDAETDIHIGHYVLNVLGSTIEENLTESLAYRRHGEDSLTWGEPDEWILAQWLRSLSQYSVQSSPETLLARLQESYPPLQKALLSARFSEIERRYEFRGRERVRSFLIDNPGLIEFLDDSFYYLLKHFGSEGRYILEAVNYPEGPESDSLVVIVSTGLSATEASRRLDEVDKEWYFKHIDQIGQFVNFNLESQ